MKQTIPFIALLSFFSATTASFAAEKTAAERGREVAQKAKDQDIDYGDMTADMSMTLTNRHGQKSTRAIRSRNLEVKGDGDKLMSIFDTPRDVKGTAFLSFTHREGADDQWLYLPALKRVKRITTNNKSGPFMGSEFAYEDLLSQEVEKFTYKYIKEETINGRKAHVVERYPVYDRSGYTRQVGWYDAEHNYLHKVDFYDRRDELLKTLTYIDQKAYLDRYHRPDQMRMKNHKTGKETLLIWTNYKFRTGLTERDFDQNALKRVR